MIWPSQRNLDVNNLHNVYVVEELTQFTIVSDANYFVQNFSRILSRLLHQCLILVESMLCATKKHEEDDHLVEYYSNGMDHDFFGL